MIKIVFCDIDGCMGNFVKPDYPLKQDLTDNRDSLKKIKKKVENFPLKETLFGVCTGRSFYQADHIMEHSGHQGPSIFEMGNIIYEPDVGVYPLFERHERFNNVKEVIREFINWKNKMINEIEIKEKFKDSGVRQMKDRICMLTFEFDKDIGNELYEYIINLMPVNIKEAIDKSILKAMISKNAIDILPNLNKGDAVTYLINKYNINKKEVLAIGDSNHSDIDLLNASGLIACPDNADDMIKEFVIKNNGFIVPSKFSDGLITILDMTENFIKLNDIKNDK